MSGAAISFVRARRAAGIPFPLAVAISAARRQHSDREALDAVAEHVLSRSLIARRREQEHAGASHDQRTGVRRSCRELDCKIVALAVFERGVTALDCLVVPRSPS